MRATSVRRCQTVPTPAPPSSTRYPGETGRPGGRSLRGKGVATLEIAVIFCNYGYGLLH